jgi:hypothetical protein
MKKVCPHCKTEFEVQHGLQIYCDARCKKRAEMKRYNVRRYRLTKDVVYWDKVLKGCSRCSEKRPSCLQYHHLDPKTKFKGISEFLSSGRQSVKILEAEITKCILLCANCHAVEENGDGYRTETDRRRGSNSISKEGNNGNRI